MESNCKRLIDLLKIQKPGKPNSCSRILDVDGLASLDAGRIDQLAIDGLFERQATRQTQKPSEHLRLSAAQIDSLLGQIKSKKDLGLLQSSKVDGKMVSDSAHNHIFDMLLQKGAYEQALELAEQTDDLGGTTLSLIIRYIFDKFAQDPKKLNNLLRKLFSANHDDSSIRYAIKDFECHWVVMIFSSFEGFLEDTPSESAKKQPSGSSFEQREMLLKWLIYLSNRLVHLDDNDFQRCHSSLEKILDTLKLEFCEVRSLVDLKSLISSFRYRRGPKSAAPSGKSYGGYTTEMVSF